MTWPIGTGGDDAGDTARAALARAWALRRPYLAVHLAATALTAVALGPLLALCARLAAGLSGAPAVADQDIARLMLTPAGLIGVLVLISVSVAAGVLELVVMIALDDDARRGAAPSVWRAARRVAPRLRAIVQLSGGAVLRLALRAAPFALVAALAGGALLAEHDINYYLSARPPAFLWAVAIGAVLALAMAAVVAERLLAWALTLPAVTLGGVGPRAALRLSGTLMAGRRRALMIRVAQLGVAVTGLSIAAGGVAALIARVTAPDAAAGVERLAAHILISMAVLAVVNVIATGAALGGLASLLGGVYGAAGGPSIAPVKIDARPPRRGAFAALLVLAGAAGAAGAAHALVQGLHRPDQVAVIAHRGAAGARPENTLPAMRKAIEDGADWVEIDVQETADGEVVVFHDGDFMKLAGVDLKVHAATMAEIARIDIGSWFDPAYADARAPTLRAVLDVAKGRAKVLIELKHYGHARQLEARVAAIVAAAGMEDQVAAMSLDHASAARMKALRPDWRVGLLAATAVGDLTRLDADFLAVSARLATPDLIRRARARGRDVYVWTVNDAAAMSRMISRGAAGVITDEPGAARAVIAARAQLSAPERLALLAADLFGVRAPVAGGRAATP